MLLISSFRVFPSFCFKARISDKPLMSKLTIFFTLLQKMHYFTSNVSHLASFLFAGYVPLASQSPYSIIVYSMANYRPHLSTF